MRILSPEEQALRARIDSFWHELLTADWEADSGPIRFSSDLVLADLAKALKNKSDWPGIGTKDDIRTTPLWRKFIHFSYNAGGPQ